MLRLRDLCRQPGAAQRPATAVVEVEYVRILATSAMLIAELPELGTMNRQKIAALVGVAPSITNPASGVAAP